MTTKTKTKKAVKTATVSMSAKTYDKVWKAAKRYSSKKDGRITRTSVELANVIGCSPRTVSNALYNMRKAKLVKKEGTTRNAIYYFV